MESTDVKIVNQIGETFNLFLKIMGSYLHHL